MKKSILFSMLLAGNFMLANADEARLLRFPSTNGKEVVFSYAGDLYKVSINGGQAQRLTSDIGYEMFAHYSPDGKSIAFTGQYDGNTEVYLIPAEGGEPKRMTFTATNSRDDLGDRMGPNNIVMGWTPDGKRIIYRNRISDGFEGKLWEVSLDGGLPTQIPLPEGGFCSYSPDGKKLAYNRVFREFRNWKYYRGGMADDIWVYDAGAKKVQNVTNNKAQDIEPMWLGDDIYFASDRDLRMNLFVYHTKTGQTEKVTDYKDYDVKFPSSDGKIIVYENGGYLYSYDPATKQSKKIPVTLASDNVIARPELKNVAKNVTAASLSWDGNRIAVTARGEVFDVPAKKGVTKDITRTPGANERQADWSPDGKNIAYISDRTGETELWLQPAEGGEPVQLTKDNDTYIRSFTWSPDSRHIVYTDRKNRIVEVDVASKAKKTLLENPTGEIREVNYSPDSKWLTYAKTQTNRMNVVYVYNLADGKEYPVTDKWYNSSSPAFSSDGRYLLFSSDRELHPVYGSLEWNHVYTRTGGIYMALLQKATPSPFLPQDETVSATVPAASSSVKPGKKAAKETTVTKGLNVQIDTEGIGERIIKIPVGASYYTNFFSDGKKIWYYTLGGTKVFDLATQEESTVAPSASMSVAFNSKKALFYKGSNLYITDFPVTKAALTQDVDLSNMVAPVDYAKEWAQIYDETWRAYRDGFYEPNMHGADWKALKAKYAALLPYVKTRIDLNYVVSGLIGELACGHCYINPGEVKGPKRIKMGLLGAEISRTQDGYFRIERILQGAPYSNALRSPLNEPGMKVKVGDYITAVDGVSVKTTDNLFSLLVGKANVLTELNVNSVPSDNGAHKIVIKPIENEYPLYHYEWVQENIRKVEKATNGRVGYVYIPDMGPDGLNEFARYYYPQLDKEALIIDDRNNGGGNISPMLIERLLRKPYRMTMYRGSNLNGTIPDGTLVGPKVLLINKYSASDGDLFPWSFRATGLGKLIGTRTWGGIIGISGSLPYMDGTDVRVPFFTNYDAKTGKWIVENHGVDPDIVIDNDPIQEEQGIDQQLNKAIEVIMEELKDRKPLPSTPAPRTYKDLGL